MSDNPRPPAADRRAFLRRSTMIAGSVAIGVPSLAQHTLSGHGETKMGADHAAAQPPEPLGNPDQTWQAGVRADFEGFNRFAPSRGNDPDSDYYIGKLVPGLREPGDGPAPFVTPDIDKLPWRMRDGAKEFELIAQPVEREFLPGYKMNVWGFNGSMPGPTIEATQGDRVRIIVHNQLPEDTTVHWHGFELPVQYDGSDTMTQNPIKPGESYVYEFDIHEEGTFFYHTHVAMQEAFGMVGFFIVHPKKPWDPPVDRDFGLIFQNFFIEPSQTIADSWKMDWNWHTINGRSGPFATPLVCRHGERVRIRLLNFSPMQHHPIHIHGHTFWITGHEGARIPKSAWVPRNTELVAIAQATNFELIANNPGDWMFHCHMVHHMMNHMTQQVGPRIRKESIDRYLANLDVRPPVGMIKEDPGFLTPGYPQGMQGMEMQPDFMQAIWNRREMMGMRATTPMSMMGLMTAFRVLPEDLYQIVMESDEPVEKGAVFAEIVRRFGNPEAYKSAPMKMHG